MVVRVYSDVCIRSVRSAFPVSSLRSTVHSKEGIKLTGHKFVSEVVVLVLSDQQFGSQLNHARDKWTNISQNFATSAMPEVTIKLERSKVWVLRYRLFLFSEDGVQLAVARK